MHLLHESLALDVPLGRGVVRKGFQLAGIAQTGRELLHEGRGQASEDTVGRQNRQAGIVDVGEIHHHEVKPFLASSVWC